MEHIYLLMRPFQRQIMRFFEHFLGFDSELIVGRHFLKIIYHRGECLRAFSRKVGYRTIANASASMDIAK